MVRVLVLLLFGQITNIGFFLIMVPLVGGLLRAFNYLGDNVDRVAEAVFSLNLRAFAGTWGVVAAATARGIHTATTSQATVLDDVDQFVDVAIVFRIDVGVEQRGNHGPEEVEEPVKGEPELVGVIENRWRERGSVNSANLCSARIRTACLRASPSLRGPGYFGTPLYVPHREDEDGAQSGQSSRRISSVSAPSA